MGGGWVGDGGGGRITKQRIRSNVIKKISSNMHTTS